MLTRTTERRGVLKSNCVLKSDFKGESAFCQLAKADQFLNMILE